MAEQLTFDSAPRQVVRNLLAMITKRDPARWFDSFIRCLCSVGHTDLADYLQGIHGSIVDGKSYPMFEPSASASSVNESIFTSIERRLSALEDQRYNVCPMCKR